MCQTAGLPKELCTLRETCIEFKRCADVIIKEGLKVDGSKASYDEVYEEGSFRRKSEKAQKLRKTTKIETKRNDQPELFEIVVDHAEENIQWKKGQVITCICLSIL